MERLNHFDENGKAIMVDVSLKCETQRKAVAEGRIHLCSDLIDLIENQQVEKGDVLGVSRIAGILGSKKTSELIPMCHPLFISSCRIDFRIDRENNEIIIISEAKTEGKTGVEMEALTAVSVAALTIYDMCKAVDKKMEIGGIRLLTKMGGKSGYISNSYTDE